MRALVAYSSKYGATEGIAERIGARLRSAGHHADVLRCRDVDRPEEYDAFVVGSAAYMGKWRKEARSFVERHSGLLAAKPTWLFSSGPLGTERVDKDGNDVLVAAEPKQFDEYEERIHPRGRMVFFGALDVDQLRGPDRIVSWMPANDALPQGDFRDWHAIDGWADRVAAELATSAESRR
jgi:menaquinone-dependent protoporphyrinogen oxidase